MIHTSQNYYHPLMWSCIISYVLFSLHWLDSPMKSYASCAETCGKARLNSSKHKTHGTVARDNLSKAQTRKSWPEPGHCDVPRLVTDKNFSLQLCVRTSAPQGSSLGTAYKIPFVFCSIHWATSWLNWQPVATLEFQRVTVEQLLLQLWGSWRSPPSIPAVSWSQEVRHSGKSGRVSVLCFKPTHFKPDQCSGPGNLGHGYLLTEWD